MESILVKRLRSIIIALVAALALSGIASANDHPRPEWLPGTSTNNMAVNHMTWYAFLIEVNDEIMEADNRVLMGDLVGEGLSVTLDYIKHINGYDTSNDCRENMQEQFREMAMIRALFLAAMYHGLVATQGSPADVQFFAEQGQIAETSTLAGLNQQCLEKLNVE